MRKIAFYTLGCKVNQSDTASMERLFREAGYEIVDFAEKADIYLINTCVVTNMGQRKSRQMIHRAIRKNPNAFIVVSGCYPQTAAEEVKAIQGVDLIIGNQDRAAVVTLVEAAATEQSIDAYDNVKKLSAQTAFEELSADCETEKTRAFLKIQEGCNQFCTYCIIPYARGPLRSRSLENIKDEVEKLVAAGFSEVVLIGIHLGAYGKELKNGTSLTDAVKAALAVTGLARVRLGSLESVEVGEDLLDLMASDERVQRQLHLPLQTGCDDVLKSMHRPYDTKIFAELIQKIRAKLPDVAITTDVIVGFPGETEENFAATKEFVRSCGFSKIHIFPFSPRKGTPAASFSGVVSEKVKQRRAVELAEVDRESHEKYCESMLDKTVTVLFEQESAEGLWEGLSGNYVRVYAKSEDNLSGKIRKITLKDLYKDGMIGEIL
ncbi:MAG: tRNA (N(6)-L-threonylcarbamoyladenosine(37)-C(2))-methylthiotransferase MtaB [Acidaminococcaceae bacterium]|nr:tRNA (N(6)-L-threonylcarbamoyladenosine(37)-C(2))-methylthiotransferase MtaB [Acidaminococcaceae bacterium]